MTAEQVISIVRNRIGKPFHEEVIRYNIGRAYASLMTQQKDLTPFRKTYESVAVEEHTASEKYYSLLPAIPVHLYDAIRIYTAKGTRFDYVPVRDGEMRIMADLDAGLVTDKVAFFLRNDRVWYENMPDTTTTVTMEIAINFESYEDTDTVFLPIGLEEQLITMTVNFLMGSPPDPKLNE